MGGLIFLLHVSGKTMGFVLGKLRKRRRNGFAVETPEFSIAVTLVFFLFFIYFSSGTDGAEVYLNR